MNAAVRAVGLLPPVMEALDSLEATFPNARLIATPDGAGGARVIVDSIDLGEAYTTQSSWIGGHLAAQLPYADVYPLFFRGDLARRDRRPLGAGLSTGHMFEGRQAVQASRRSNRKDPALESVPAKFLKVAEWVRRHPGG